MPGKHSWRLWSQSQDSQWNNDMTIEMQSSRFIRIDKRRNIAYKCFVLNLEDQTQRCLNRLSFKNEVRALKVIKKHKNVVEFFGYGTREEWAGVRIGFIALEYLARRSLNITVFSPNVIYSDHTIFRWIENILEGLTWIHAKNVKHADIKLKNLMVSLNYTIKIGDFDVSFIEETSETKEIERGTWRVKAPELIRNNFVSRKNDIWSFGIVCWELIMREMCLIHEMAAGQMERLSLARQLELPKLRFSHPICDLVILCTIQNQKLRPDAKDVLKRTRKLMQDEEVNYKQRQFEPEEIKGNANGSPPLPIGFVPLVEMEDEGYNGNEIELPRDISMSAASRVIFPDDYHQIENYMYQGLSTASRSALETARNTLVTDSGYQAGNSQTVEVLETGSFPPELVHNETQRNCESSASSHTESQISLENDLDSLTLDAFFETEIPDPSMKNESFHKEVYDWNTPFTWFFGCCSRNNRGKVSGLVIASATTNPSGQNIYTTEIVAPNGPNGIYRRSENVF